MLSREFKKIYHPRMGRYVYKHRGNGLIVDTLMKPLKSVAKSVLGNVVKPFAKKAIKAGVSHAGERVGKKAADKASPAISVTTIQRDLREVDFTAALPFVSTGSYPRDARYRICSLYDKVWPIPKPLKKITCFEESSSQN